MTQMLKNESRVVSDLVVSILVISVLVVSVLVVNNLFTILVSVNLYMKSK